MDCQIVFTVWRTNPSLRLRTEFRRLAMLDRRRASSPAQSLKALYTPEQRLRRDATRWTLVQGILAPIQFAVFLISLALVVRYLFVGEGFAVATASIVVKTLVLYAIMITGSIWEREVFGCYLFASAFFWEDVTTSCWRCTPAISSRCLPESAARASRCCSRWRHTRHTSSMPRSSY